MNEDNLVKILFSKDSATLCDPSLSGYTIHLICLNGEGSFKYEDKVSRLSKNDVAVINYSGIPPELDFSSSVSLEILAAPTKYLITLLHPGEFVSDGFFKDSVLHLEDNELGVLLNDIHNIKSRLEDRTHAYYNEMIGGLCLTMMNDLMSFQSRREEYTPEKKRSAYVVDCLTKMLESGQCRTHRSVSYYASHLNVTSKYLSSTVKRHTGVSVSQLIGKYSSPIIAAYLNDQRLSMQQVSEIMNFNSLSYFSRYCSRHLGMNPSLYRAKYMRNMNVDKTALIL